jgi:hypothetical protein
MRRMSGGLNPREFVTGNIVPYQARVDALERELRRAIAVLRKHLHGKFHNPTLKAITHAEAVLNDAPD